MASDNNENEIEAGEHENPEAEVSTVPADSFVEQASIPNESQEDSESAVSVDAEVGDEPVSPGGENVDLDKLKKIVEGALFAAAKPMTIDQLGNLFHEDERPEKGDFQAVLQTLSEDYADRGVLLKQVASGYRFQVTEGVGQWVSRLWEEKPARYSRALLETLALIAYRQPITRGEIEEIRGVSTSSHIMKTLQEREWIRIVGHRDVPGRPAMYATTRLFLDYFNLTNLDELPSLAEIRDLGEINRELDLKSEEALQGTQAEVDDATVKQDAENLVAEEQGLQDGMEQQEETQASTLDESVSGEAGVDDSGFDDSKLEESVVIASDEIEASESAADSEDEESKV